MRRAARGALAAALFAPVLTASAADAPLPAPAGEMASMRAEMLAPGIYRFGANGTVLRVDVEGAIVVDPGRPGTHGHLMAEIRRIAKRPDVPVRALILTAVEPGQADNVAPFVDAGVPVVVQRTALARLAEAASKAGGATPKPFVSYDMDRVVGDGDLRAEVEHVGRARTGADSIVYFRDLRAVAVGGLFTHGTPELDCASGGSYAGWAAAITHLLWFDFDIAVPGRGAVVGKPELLAFRSKLQALAARTSLSPQGASDCPSPK